jgi:hypothetical protein
MTTHKPAGRNGPQRRGDKRAVTVMNRVIILATLILAVPASEAMAVSQDVKDACREDYYNYCSSYEVGSKALRSCMRAARRKLSPGCAKALARSGEATSEDIRDYKRRR